MKGEKIFSCIILALAVLFLIGSLFIVPFKDLTITSPAGYAIFMSVLCVIVACVIVFGSKFETDIDESRHVFDPTIVAFIIMLILYVAAIMFLHYTIATLLFIFAAVFYLRRDSMKQAILISYISTFMILLVFKYIFSVIMP